MINGFALSKVCWITFSILLWTCNQIQQSNAMPITVLNFQSRNNESNVTEVVGSTPVLTAAIEISCSGTA